MWGGSFTKAAREILEHDCGGCAPAAAVSAQARVQNGKSAIMLGVRYAIALLVAVKLRSER